MSALLDSSRSRPQKRASALRLDWIPAFAGMSGAMVLFACQSLTTVDKTPGADTVAELLVDNLQCRDTAETKCDPGAQPRAIKLADFDCEALPLRPEAREAAHAVCDFSGEIIRADGERVALAPSRREFSLIDLTPGQYVPERAWTIVSAKPPAS